MKKPKSGRGAGYAFGKRNAQAKLTSREVAIVKQMHAEGKSYKEICAFFKFRVSPSTVSGIIKGRTRSKG